MNWKQLKTNCKSTTITKTNNVWEEDERRTSGKALRQTVFATVVGGNRVVAPFVAAVADGCAVTAFSDAVRVLPCAVDRYSVTFSCAIIPVCAAK